MPNYRKIYELQKLCKPIIKSSDNPFYHSKYSDINALLSEIKPHLEALQLAIIQPVVYANGKNVLFTYVIDAEEEAKGDAISSIYSSIVLPDFADPQKLGSAITYYRRYSLQSLLLLEAKDDDGNATVEVEKKVAVPANPATSPVTLKIKENFGVKPVTNEDKKLSAEEEAFWLGMGDQVPPPATAPVTPAPIPGVKVEGGICLECGTGVYVKSRTKGTLYCNAKCWLN